MLFHLRDAFRPATSGWRGRAATATSERRCCRLPPSLMPTAVCRLRPVRTTGSPSAGRKPPCRTGPLTLVADLYRRMPAARPGELLAHVSPLGWEHINLTGEYRWPGADPSGTAETLSVGSRCAVTRCHSPAGANPARQLSLQPVAVGAGRWRQTTSAESTPTPKDRLGRFSDHAGCNNVERCAGLETKRCGSRPARDTGKAASGREASDASTGPVPPG